MKKVLLVVSLISVLLLAGCNKNEKIKNNVPEVIENQQQEVINNIDNNDEVDNIEQYRLSENYELNGIELYNCFNVGVSSDVTGRLNDIENFDWTNVGILDYRELIDNVNTYNFESNGKTDAYLLEKSDMRLPHREKENTNKGNYGHTTIVTGQKYGAGIIAASAALSFGSGLVTAVESESTNIFDSDDKLKISIF